MIIRPDPEALLVALVLCPGTYSRNRFFSLYADPTFAAVRRRAKLVRSVIIELAHPTRRAQILGLEERSLETNQPADRFLLTYTVASLGLRRTTALSALELSLVRYAVSRRTGSSELVAADALATSRIEEALARLAPDLPNLPNLDDISREENDDDDDDPPDDEKARIPPLPKTEPE